MSSSQFQVDLWERSRLHVFLQWRHGATGKSQEKRTKMPASRKKKNRFPIALFYRQCTHPKSFRALFDSWEHHHLGTKSWFFDTSKLNALRFAYGNIGSWDDDSNELIYVSSSWPEFQLHNSTKPNIQPFLLCRWLVMKMCFCSFLAAQMQHKTQISFWSQDDSRRQTNENAVAMRELRETTRNIRNFSVIAV